MEGWKVEKSKTVAKIEDTDICNLIENTKEYLLQDLQNQAMTAMEVRIADQPPEEQVASDFVGTSRSLCYILHGALPCVRFGRLMSYIARLGASGGSALAKLTS